MKLGSSVAIALFVLVGSSFGSAMGQAGSRPDVETPAAPSVVVPAGPILHLPIVMRRAELTPQNFVRFAPRSDFAPDDTAVIDEEQVEARRRERTGLVNPQLATQPSFLDGPPPGPPGPPPTPGPAIGPLEGIALGHDPQIAAGNDYVAVIESHNASFYDKTGAPLPEPPKAGPYAVSSFEMFQRFLAQQVNGSINQDNVNLHAGFPPNPKLPCDLTKTLSAQKACIQEVYDLRVAYDAKHKRFIFVGNARNEIWNCDNYADATKCDPLRNGTNPHFCADADTTCREDVAKLVRRYTMIAITKAEDPRQGFYTYWLPTAGDWPSIAVNGSHLLITENSICHNLACPPANTYPEIYIVSTDDMASGSANVSVHWYLTDIDMPYAPGLRPVLSHDAGSPDYFVAPGSPTGPSIQVWASTDPTKPLVSATINVVETGFTRGSIVLHGGRLYYAYSSGAWCAEMKPPPADCPLKVRLLGIQPNWSNNQLSLTKVVDYSFGHNGPGDDPSDLVSYEMPSLEVNKNGDVVIAYIRRAVKTVKPLFNEARYSVFYHTDNKTHPSALLRAGQGAASQTPYGKSGLDLAVQSLDPSDPATVWVTHAYAKSSGNYGMAWGSIKP
jgi:hypothetical protein